MRCVLDCCLTHTTAPIFVLTDLSSAYSPSNSNEFTRLEKSFEYGHQHRPTVFCKNYQLLFFNLPFMKEKHIIRVKINFSEKFQKKKKRKFHNNVIIWGNEEKLSRLKSLNLNLKEVRGA